MSTQPLDQAKEPERLQEKEFQAICRLVKDKSGIVLTGERHRSMVQGRLNRRLRALGLPNFTAYCEVLAADTDEEIGHCINAVTTNVTAFFREPHHFEHLKQYLTELINRPDIKAQKKLRIWSAASSSGEEPYSIAMTVMEATQHLHDWDIKILGTDLDTVILERAKKAVYPSTVRASLPNDYAKKYTEDASSPDEFQIKQKARSLLTFNQLNLLHDWPMKGQFDAIFCRNVFIYFDAETQKNIAQRFSKLLRPQGMLYIGHSENLLGLNDIFHSEGKTMYVSLRHE